MDVENANCKIKVSECTDMEIVPIERPFKVHVEITGLERLVEELHKVFQYDHVNVQDVQQLMAGYKSDLKDWKKYAKFDRFRYTRNLVSAGNGAFNIMIICWGPGHASAIHDHADSHCFMKLLSGGLEEIRYDWPNKVEPKVRKVLKLNKPTRRCCSESEDFDSCQNHERNGAKTANCHGNGGRTDSQDGRTHQDGVDCEEDGGYCAEEMVEIGRTKLEVNDVCYINDALGLHRMENPSHIDGSVSLHLYSPPFDSCRVFDARTGRPTTVKVTFTSINGKKVQRVIEANEAADSQ